MRRLQVRNFGPIGEGLGDDGWIGFGKVTLLIGEQGSGKSSLAKLYSLFAWMEKVLYRGDYSAQYLGRKGKLKSLLRYHRIENYLREASEIAYEGERYTIRYREERLEFSENSNASYSLPAILYIPAERNFISSLPSIGSARELRQLADSLKDFLGELTRAAELLKEPRPLPLGGAKLSYSRQNRILYLQGNEQKTFKVRLSEAASGYQSAVPLLLVSDFLSSYILQDEMDMSVDELEKIRGEVQRIFYSMPDLDEQKRSTILRLVLDKYKRSAFVNVVEEPEQNLYPSSQRSVVQALLEYNRRLEGNCLVLTSHSPYILNYLSLAVKAGKLWGKIGGQVEQGRALERLGFPKVASLQPDELAIYQLSAASGKIQKLADYEGIPSDDNDLNILLDEINILYDELLDFEEGL